VPTSQKERYELWRNADGTELDFFAETNDAARRLLGPDFVLVWECRASSYIEAQQLKHAHLGWKPYEPMQDGEV
jgi:hypothetical protein